jgi:predicted lipoprotein with Yx(FWY)xxD motif
MRSTAVLLMLAAIALAGCGGDDGDGAATADSEDVAVKKDDAAMKGDAAGTTIALRDSNFGPMLFDSDGQAIYIFERDSRGMSVCYGGCAEAWPPVLTGGTPRADDGVNVSLLGTIKRRDGQRQVTYAGRPLYFYAHEDPGVVLCHNVNLNGGYWWAVGADGKRRPA